MAKITNEKEILEALERQVFMIGQQFDNQDITIKDFDELVCKNVSVSASDLQSLLPTYFSQEFLNKHMLMLDTFLEDPLRYIKRDIYPGDFEQAALLVRNQLLNNPNNQQVGFIQRVKNHLSGIYEGYYTLTKVLKHKNELVNIGIPLSSLGIVTNKLTRVLIETDYMRKNYQKFTSLTAREREIITLLALGYQNNEIGDQLFISKATVEQHRKNLKRKLEIKRFVDLIRFAQAFDMI